MDLPLHPKLVHLPIALGVLMPLVTAGLLVAWWRGWLPRRTWLIAVVLQGLLVGSGLVAQRSGEADEERVERVVPEALIEAHEEAATAFVGAAAAVLVLAAAAAAVRSPRVAQGLAALSTAGALLVLAPGYRVGEAGGRLVYQHGAAAAFAAPDAAAAPVRSTPGARRDRGDDDD
jgi:hypothetical protein